MDIFFSFLKLGCIAFGGPVAHLSFFRRVFVENKRWLSEAQYAELVAICQIMPGPASSQVGFCLGWIKGGITGALLAFIAFTLPSALLLIGFAHASQSIFENEWFLWVIESLKLLAIFVVFQAVLAMGKSFCKTTIGIALGLLAMALTLAFSFVWLMPLIVLASLLIGAKLIPEDNNKPQPSLDISVSKANSAIAFVLFVGLFVALSIASDFVVFFHAGALVFGGGHVVLPLLEAPLVQGGIIEQSTFMSGYGATQIVPGPIFTFASYLGFQLPTETGFTNNPYINASIATILIFTPGFLLLIIVLPYWQILNQHAWFKKGIAGASAAVVGVLAATLIDPILLGTVKEPMQLALVLVGLIILIRFSLSLTSLILLCMTISSLSYLL